MKYWVALTLALVLNSAANLMMKFGVKRLVGPGAAVASGGGVGLAALLTNWVLIAGLVCFATNVVFYVYALSGIKISIAYPLMVGGGFAIIALVAWRFLGETLSPIQWMGIVLILIGVCLVAQMRTAAASCPGPVSG